MDQDGGFINKKKMTMLIATRKSAIKFNKIKGTKIVTETNHDIHELLLCHLAIGIFLNLPDGLIGCANWYEHSSRRFELVDESFRKLLRCGANMNSIIGSYTKIKVISIM